MKRIILAAALTGAAFGTSPAIAAQSFDGVLDRQGIANFRFSFTGGPFSVAVNSSGTAEIVDPTAWVFADNGSSLSSKTGSFIAQNDDYRGELNSFISLPSLAAGNYILTVSACCLTEAEARRNQGVQEYSNRTFQVVFGDGIGLSDPLPEPATWGLMLAGFGMIGRTMRYGRTARLRAREGKSAADGML